MNKQQVVISKFLSYVLRHKPDAIGLRLDKNGWADILELIKCANLHDNGLTKESILDVVKNNDKKRFKLSPDATKIRASQGHSLNVDLELKTQRPPEYLYHGTAMHFLSSILENGIHSSSRKHVHLSVLYETAEDVGRRYGKPIVLIIDSKKMHNDGNNFFLSDNGVWLTEYILSLIHI